MQRILEFLLLSAVFVIAAASAQGQVAVSEMVPSAPRIIDPTEVIPTASFVTPNPAAMQWGAPSRWGGGTISSDREQTAPTTGTPVEFGGIYAGARVLGKDLTVAGYMIELSDDTNAFSLEADWNVVAGGVAFQSGDNITFGVSMERADNTISGLSLDINTINLGLSVKASDKIYLGLALGSEDISAASESGDRSVQKYGVGYRAGGQSQTHFEAYVVEREENDQFFAGAFSDSSEKVLVAEVILGSLFLGGSFSTISQDRNRQEIEALIFDIGWAPKNGLALLYHQETATMEVKDSAGAVTSEDETTTTAISIAWSF